LSEARAALPAEAFEPVAVEGQIGEQLEGDVALQPRRGPEDTLSTCAKRRRVIS
jgi:hypothetical protein